MKHKVWITFLVLCSLLLPWGASVGAQGSDILHVKPGGAGTCTDFWDNACDLQTALGVASAGDEIWVAEGIHLPTSESDPTATFRLKNGVALYGGFEGSETSVEQRDWESNITVLSGDIDHNDLTDPNGVVTDTVNIVGDNSYNVVTSSGTDSTALLDGFTVTGGYAAGSYWPAELGGGMYNEYGSPTLTNVTFSGNSGGWTGGMFNNAGSPMLTNVTFTGNSGWYAGGGMMDIFGSPSLTNVTFTDNYAGQGGGMQIGLPGMCCSRPTLTNVTFSGNSASWNGGGMSCQTSHPTLTNVTFSGNSASWNGGGMYDETCIETLTNVTFSGNSADNGGGMFNYSFSRWSTLTNVTFSGNSADNGGGMVIGEHSCATLTNVTFSGNSASSYGGGIYNYDSFPWPIGPCKPPLTNSILWGNTAPEGPQIYNVVLSGWDNFPIISYSLVEGSGGSGAGWDDSLGTDGGGNIDADPQFMEAANSDLHLQGSSPAIDMGDNSALPADIFDLDGDGDTAEPLPIDLDGNPRIINGIVDMGGFEYPPPDSDQDGLSDYVEDGAPNGGDGNGDGSQDSDQANVASLPNAEDGQYVTLASPEGTSFVGVQAVDNPSPGDAPPGVEFPVGFFEFMLQGIDPGGATTVTQLLPPETTVDTYYKYGPTPDNETDHWYEFLFDNETGAEILSDRVILHFVDGQRGDGDLTANGELVEPGAPGFISNRPPTVAADESGVTVGEGQTATNTGTVSDLDGDTVTLSASVGTITNNGDGTWSWSFATTDGPDESQTVTIYADDGKGGAAETTFALMVNNVPPTIMAITGPMEPVNIINDQPISVSADFSDPGGTNDAPYSCTFDYDGDGLGDETVQVTSTTCIGMHNYSEAGVYTVLVAVTDKDGDSGTATYQYVVVYDPEGGFVTGGGWIWSEPGAYAADETLEGKATFGFVSKYKRGATIPTGETEFQFRVANLNFHSDSYDWLVVAGTRAQYKGSGTINGEGDYGFMLTAVDAALTSSTDVDLFRIKIWDKASDTVVYDSQPGEDDDAKLTTEIRGGSIVIHTR